MEQPLMNALPKRDYLQHIDLNNAHVVFLLPDVKFKY